MHNSKDLLNKLPLNGHNKKPSNLSEEFSSGRPLSAHQEKLINRFWLKMTDIFKGKWTSTEGELTDDYGELTLNARQWVNKLDTVSMDQIKYGLDELERRSGDAFRECKEKDFWPPNPTQFVAICHKPSEPRYYKPFRKALPVDDATKTKRKKAGGCELEKMKNILGDL